MSRLGLWHPAALIATWFGAGLVPVAPGTAGSLAALPFAWAIDRWLGKPSLAVAGALLFLIGIWASGLYAERMGIADPGEVCVDEVAAMWIMAALLPLSIVGYAIGFLAFRAADILKPWPANVADRKIKGGLGIMLDDILVLPHATLVSWLLLWIIP
jgi:phosphatidylglycerophosphatase A